MTFWALDVFYFFKHEKYLFLKVFRKTLAFLIVFLFLFTIPLCAEELIPFYEESDLYKDVFLEHHSIMMLVDAEIGWIENVNQAAADFYGYTIEEMRGMHFQDINASPDGELIEVREAAMRGEKVKFITSHRLASGDVRIMEVHALPYNYQGKTFLFNTLYDITREVLKEESLRSRSLFFFVLLSVGIFVLSLMVIVLKKNIRTTKEMKKILEEERELLKITFLSVGDGIISTDKNGNIELLNKVAEQLTGWSQEEASGLPFEDVFSIFNEYTKERCENPVQKVLETGETVELANHTILVSKDGSERPIEDSAAPIKDAKGEIKGVVIVFRDFTEKKEKQDQIEYLSFHDQLTGLYNRRFFEAELKRLDTKRSLPLSLIMGDLNELKIINDAFGHQAGDQLLKEAACAIRKSCRIEDIIARWGGDEFVILLPNTDGKEAKEIISRIISATEAIEQEKGILSISFGCATKNNLDEDIEEVFKNAEDIMYRNKLIETPIVRKAIIEDVLKKLFQKYKYEEEHAVRVSELCVKIGSAMDLGITEIDRLSKIGRVHDIGKIAIASDILCKQDKLTTDEWHEIKRHPETGYRVLGGADDISGAAMVILSHHERWDGRGYPKGLKGEEIPLKARILAVAEAYDAMTNDFPYRKALSVGEAVAELRDNAGEQFDPKIVQLFVEEVLKR